MTRFSIYSCALLVLAGCTSNNPPAPITDRSGAPARTSAPVVLGSTARKDDTRPEIYIVKQGDTLYSIALNNGLDYHDIAALNGIADPAAIKTGQELRLFRPGTVIAGKSESAPMPKPEEVKMPGSEVKPDAAIPVEVQPQVIKLPYSDTAAAQIEKMQSVPVSRASAAPAPARPEAAPLPKTPAPPVVTPATATTAPAPVPTTPASTALDEDGDINWGMPTDGKLISGFSESDNRKGIDIAGKMGQPIFASAAGKVVYSGTGLRGLGNLVIVKHNNTWLSAYAHNSKILVKEGQTVSKGQQIAEMGNSDASQVMLHFEIRRLGKPVDPAKYLPK